MSESPIPEASRLEHLWAGQFGDDYVERNKAVYAERQDFWRELIGSLQCSRVLEVGCNVGGNLRWIGESVDPSELHGVDVNRKALAELRRELPDVNAVWSPARELPYRDKWFDLVFTMGVLIHQPDATLPLVMSEMVRTSQRWVFCGEYYAPEQVEVPYRGQEGALFKRDYGRLFEEWFPVLRLHSRGYLGREQGWDDVTWWLFSRT